MTKLYFLIHQNILIYMVYLPITLCNLATAVARLDDIHIPREGGAPTHSLVLAVGQEINTEQVWLLYPFLSVRVQAARSQLLN